MDNRPIGIFDSGVGGLTVVKEIMKQLPNEDIMYFGDTGRVPYGTKSSEIVNKYTFQCIRFLLSKDTKLIVIACNTASSVALEEAKRYFDVPIIGVIDPGAKHALNTSKNNRIGIIGTEGTIKSMSYNKAILKRKESVELFNVPCPLFVPLAEEGWSNDEIALLTAKKYLDSLIQEDIDTLVMGCTHYPLLEDTIQTAVGNKVILVNPAYYTAKQVKDTLIALDKSREGKHLPPEYIYYASDNEQKFKDVGNRFLDKKIHSVEKVDIENY